MKEIKLKECVVCGEDFMPFKTTEKVCSLTCALAYAKSDVDKKNAKAWQKEKKIRKEKLKTHKDWLQDLQKDFNTFIRLRDRDEPCISCGTIRTDIKYDAGHFWTTGGFPNVRFDEDNVHKQCSNNCNFKKSGNINEYRPRLIKKIGIERFEALEFRARNVVLKLSIPEIKEKIEYYLGKIKEMKNEIIYD
ncbi:recombination protein NinG [Chryseobacterium sediminis]|uniref:Recombination protein NinG n=1 Tax=Chryseobacterium sediminis TaxID=1679494 RepID=A0A5B2U9J1_9FLAO|nr:recombination protein NinG [Chryseobacterium sediminis]KAA2223027.1 recombination protein NinG [Chryseobacterium sediminis]